MRTTRRLRRGLLGLRGGFTLIELLVVIAVIAILIGMLLPALGRVRREGWKTISQTNLRSLGQAGAMYQSDNRGILPIVPNGVPVPNPIYGWITWGGWGKFTGGGFWLGGGGIFDVPPNARPLNPYLYPEYLPRAVDGNQMRAGFQMVCLRDPSDKIGHQQAWNAFDPSYGVSNPNADGSTCYNDVGTSYLLQAKWFFQTLAYLQRTRGDGRWTSAWHFGVNRIKTGDSFLPSRFIWVADEYCDITINQHTDSAMVKNGYGDFNKSCVTFLDGHVRYMNVIPGGESDQNRILDPTLVPAFCNSEYTVVFPDLR